MSSTGTMVASPEYSAGIIYTTVTGDAITLTSSWTLVASMNANHKGLRLSPIVGAAVYDIEWISVVANTAAPTATYGEPILAGEDFSSGYPLGDVYLKSASGQKVLVKVGK